MLWDFGQSSSFTYIKNYLMVIQLSFCDAKENKLWLCSAPIATDTSGSISSFFLVNYVNYLCVMTIL